MYNSHGDTQSAMIIFENDEAAKTAIFLNDTFMYDGTINVISYSEHVGEKTPTENTNQQTNQQSNQQNGSFWVNSLASAYMFGSRAWQKVLEFDDKHKISSTINEKANQIDKSLKISERSREAAKKLEELAGNVDKKLHIKEGTQKISDKTSQTLTNLRERNEKTQNFFKKLDEVGQKIGHTWEDAMKNAQQKVDLVKNEIKRREEQNGETETVQMEVMDDTPLLQPESTSNTTENNTENNTENINSTTSQTESVQTETSNTENSNTENNNQN